jgi:hypothetical protein
MAFLRRIRPRPVLAFVGAVLVTALGGSIVQTQLNLAALAALGVDISAAVRVRTTIDDLLGFAPAWAAIVAAGFLVALPLCAWLTRRGPAWRDALFSLAAALAVLTALLSMRLALGLTAIAAARSLLGLLLLAAAGALGGWAYARLTRQPAAGRTA